MGTVKGFARIYQQTFVDIYSKWTAAKLYTTKTPITGADLLNDRVLPFGRNGLDGCPHGGMLAMVFVHHAHRALVHLGGKLV